jgi:hypothetical protein
MHNNECTWKVVATAEAANDDVYEYNDWCGACGEDTGYCRCDEEN